MPVQLIARGLLLILSGVAGYFGYEFTADEQAAEAAVSGIVAVVSIVTAWKWRRKPPTIPPAAMLFLLLPLVGCFPSAEDASDAQQKLQLKRDQLHEIAGEARGVYVSTALVCAQKMAQSVEVLRDVCARHEQVFAVFDRGYTLAAKTLNAAQAGLMTYEAAAGAVDALDGLLDQVHELFQGVTNAVAEGAGQYIAPSAGDSDRGSGDHRGAEAGGPASGSTAAGERDVGAGSEGQP